MHDDVAPFNRAMGAAGAVPILMALVKQDHAVRRRAAAEALVYLALDGTVGRRSTLVIATGRS